MQTHTDRDANLLEQQKKKEHNRKEGNQNNNQCIAESSELGQTWKNRHSQSKATDSYSEDGLVRRKTACKNHKSLQKETVSNLHQQIARVILAGRNKMYKRKWCKNASGQVRLVSFLAVSD